MKGWGWELYVIISICGILATMLILATVEYVWPSHPAWREIQDDVYIDTYYLPENTCDPKGNCTTSMTMYTRAVCVRGHWECVKGRDGEKVCKTKPPIYHTCQYLSTF